MFHPNPLITFATARDGRRLAARRWDVVDPVAHVVCLHGIVSHGGWYESSCAHLASQRFCVHMLDRRGSGLNAEARGDVDCWSTWLDDVAGYLESLSEKLPRILLGISWGGTLAAAVARQRGDLLAGVGLICPGLYSRKAANIWQRGALRLAHALRLRHRRVTIPLQDPSLFSHTEQAQGYIATDPLALRKITIRFAVANLDLTRYATQRPEAIQVPVLAVLAGQDPITINSRVREFVARIDHSSQSVIEYPGASHTLEFEPDPSCYFHDLAQWCHQAAAGELR